jgi:uncharacterized protein with GYD domain
MPRYLFIVEYSREALGGLMKQGGTGRRPAVEKLVADVGGQMESLHWSPEGVAYVIASLPEQRAAATISFLVLSAGAANTVRVVDLLTPEEIDEAVRVSIDYQPPG